jgi:hypothetical protein
MSRGDDDDEDEGILIEFSSLARPRPIDAAGEIRFQAESNIGRRRRTFGRWPRRATRTQMAALSISCTSRGHNVRMEIS